MAPAQRELVALEHHKLAMHPIGHIKPAVHPDHALRSAQMAHGIQLTKPARVLGLWAPPEPALAFMRDIGAALTPDNPPNPGPNARDIHPARQPSSALTPRQSL
jgi:hypothetical protein